jgi:small subunit ribosomal protein S17
MNKTLTGVVVSNKMEKTIVVRVERKFRHARYQKVVTSHKKYKARNEDPAIQLGDTVVIQSVRPIAKSVSFTVIEKIK